MLLVMLVAGKVEVCEQRRFLLDAFCLLVVLLLFYVLFAIVPFAIVSIFLTIGAERLSVVLRPIKASDTFEPLSLIGPFTTHKWIRDIGRLWGHLLHQY